MLLNIIINNKIIPRIYRENETIYKAKALISIFLEPLEYDLCIYFNGNYIICDNDKTISYYNLNKESKIFLYKVKDECHKRLKDICRTLLNSYNDFSEAQPMTESYINYPYKQCDISLYKIDENNFIDIYIETNSYTKSKYAMMICYMTDELRFKIDNKDTRERGFISIDLSCLSIEDITRELIIQNIKLTNHPKIDIAIKTLKYVPYKNIFNTYNSCVYDGEHYINKINWYQHIINLNKLRCIN